MLLTRESLPPWKELCNSITYSPSIRYAPYAGVMRPCPKEIFETSYLRSSVKIIDCWLIVAMLLWEWERRKINIVHNILHSSCHVSVGIS